MEIVFLTLDEVHERHREQLELYGGAEGMVDAGVVESIVYSPIWRERLEDCDIAGLAASYLFGFATTQGFRDGNKRTGAVCADVFLQINGYELVCRPGELYEVTMLAANKLIDRDAIAAWIRQRVQPLA